MSSLGSKRIRFLETDTEHDVKSKLMSVEGFPLLSMAGGFELLNCLSNSKRLQVRGVACLKIESRQNARRGGLFGVLPRKILKFSYVVDAFLWLFWG